MQMDDKQLEAVERCGDIKQRVVAITGQAGTGKTTIMRTVYEHLTEAGYRVVLCAPTGKAAKRIQEATGYPAMTIHRLLEYPHPGERDPKTGKAYQSGEPKRDRYNPLDYDVVMADEYAMVNHEVHRNLMDALPRGGAIRVFGDINQLKPIEQNKKLEELPTPFMDLLDKFKGITLTHIHRQGEGSGIVSNGALILAGRIPRRLEDFTMSITDQTVNVLKAQVLAAKEQGIDFASTEHQVITTVRTSRSWVGSIKLNAMLQLVFRPEVDGWITLPRYTWDKENVVRLHIGDKVIWTENNYDLEIFNGETGIVTDITEYEEIEIDFGDRSVVVPPNVNTVDKNGEPTFYDPRRSLDLAYALTTHKTQGSEYKHVIYVLNKSTFYMHERANTYTAVTRAREHVHLISDQRSLSGCVQKNRPVRKA